MGYKHGPLMERVWAKVERRGEDECWPWIATVGKLGYAQVRQGQAGTPLLYVHRVVWEEAFGPIPKGLEIDHACRNRKCQNVRHMTLRTKSAHGRVSAHQRWEGRDDISDTT